MSEQQPDSPATETDTSKDSDEGTTDSTESLDSGGPGDIGDDQLPPDLQPTEENPLSRHPDQTGDEDDEIGSDREEAPETAPLTADDADYGGAGSSDSSGSSGSGGDSGNDSGGSKTDDGRVKAEEDDGSASLDNGGGGAG
jgi:hypothetical protein